MKHLDFLPPKYRENRRRRDLRITRLALTVIGLSALGLWYGAEDQKIQKARKNLSFLNQQYQSVQVGLTLIDQLRSEQKELIQKYEVIRELGPQVGYVQILAQVARFMPERMALLEYQMTSTEEKTVAPPTGTLSALSAQLTASAAPASSGRQFRTQVTVSGLARSEMDVALLVGQLSGYPKFRDIRLEYCKSDTIQGYRATAFKITFLVRTDAVPAEEKERSG